MDFVLWVCHVMHILSIVVWLGGLIFQNAVLSPVVEYEQQTQSLTTLAVQRRFLGFIWWSLWTAVVTGFLLMLLSRQFLWFDYSTLWRKLLGVKQVSFALMAFFSWQTMSVFRRMEKKAAEGGEEFEGWRLTYTRLVRRTILFGIIALLCSGGMAVAAWEK